MHRTRLTAFVTGLALVGASPLIHAAPAGATTTQHVVTTTADVVDAGDGQLSLREAITEVDADAGDSEIVLQAGATYHLSICDNGVWEHENASGDVDVDADPDLLTITGNGARIEQDCTNQRVLLTFRDLVVRNVTIASADNFGATASGEDDGAGLYVYNPADLLAEDVTFTDLRSADGPAAYTGGNAEIVRSTITGNTGEQGSAGIVMRDATGTLSVEDSLIHANTAGGGGAVLTSANDVVVRNTTIADNHVDALSDNTYASIIHASKDTLLDHTTMVGNSQNGGATLYAGVSVTVDASVLVNDGPEPECHALTPTTTSLGGTVTRDASCGTPQVTDQTNVADPGLEALADNGGATMTMLPAVASPALDAVPAADCDVATDQRGLPRPSGTACDAGAVEAQHRPDALLRRGTAGAFVGEDVYNLTAVGQTLTANAPRGATVRFGLRVENDGDLPETIVVKGNVGQGAVTARYFVAGQDVTSSVVAGRPIPLPADGTAQVGVRIRVAATAPHGITRSFTFRVRSDGLTVADRARATVHVP